MKHVNAEQEVRIMEVVNEMRKRRGEYLNGLSEYLHKRNQLVSEHQHRHFSLVDLENKLKEIRENYLRTP